MGSKKAHLMECPINVTGKCHCKTIAELPSELNEPGMGVAINGELISLGCMGCSYGFRCALHQRMYDERQAVGARK